jgi:hypothetical protein
MEPEEVGRRVRGGEGGFASPIEGGRRRGWALGFHAHIVPIS